MTGSMKVRLPISILPPNSGAMATLASITPMRTMSGATAPSRLAKRTPLTLIVGTGSSDKSMSPSIASSRPVVSFTAAEISSL